MRCGGGHGVSVSLAVTHLSLRSCSLQPSANCAATYATEFGVAAIAIYKFFSISGRCCKEIGTKKLGINWACYCVIITTGGRVATHYGSVRGCVMQNGPIYFRKRPECSSSARLSSSACSRLNGQIVIIIIRRLITRAMSEYMTESEARKVQVRVAMSKSSSAVTPPHMIRFT